MFYQTNSIWTDWFICLRFITREELRQALTQHGMGDEATIDEILEDVDTNKVSISTLNLIKNLIFAIQSCIS